MEAVLNNVNQNSISLKKNSKGLYDWEIKMYFSDNEENTMQRIKKINSELKQTYEIK